MTFPDVDAPQVAYLRTCRTYHLARADGQALDIPSQVTARATEAMRYEGGAWKLAAR